MPTPTYTLIASTTLTGSQATVTFSSIPSTYTDLVVKISARGDTASLKDQMTIKFNGDSSALYSDTVLYSDGATPGSIRDASASLIWYVNQNSSTTNTFSNTEIYIPSYTVSQSKTFGSFGVAENNSTTAYLATEAGLYRSNTAISSIAFGLNLGGNFLSGSNFYLYGIKNS